MAFSLASVVPIDFSVKNTCDLQLMAHLLRQIGIIRRVDGKHADWPWNSEISLRHHACHAAFKVAVGIRRSVAVSSGAMWMNCEDVQQAVQLPQGTSASCAPLIASRIAGTHSASEPASSLSPLSSIGPSMLSLWSFPLWSSCR